ncbi:PilZ domain-containing protein [Erythrobacteraceae bacterium E2-1 Yellow Sea]|nr:PilZ domain-containing protein [Erythrobacteraceae bacterium E2-1 Yellow Sea]
MFRAKGAMQTRKIDRNQVSIPGQCRTMRGQMIDIQLRDLTPGGCRFADPARALLLHAPVTLMIGGSGPHNARLRWREGDEVGVAFDRPLPDALLHHILSGKPIAASQSHPGLTQGLGPRRLVC